MSFWPLQANECGNRRSLEIFQKTPFATTIANPMVLLFSGLGESQELPIFRLIHPKPHCLSFIRGKKLLHILPNLNAGDPFIGLWIPKAKNGGHPMAFLKRNWATMDRLHLSVEKSLSWWSLKRYRVVYISR